MPTSSYEFYLSDEGEVLGVREYFFQQGCSHLDENEDYIDRDGYYQTELEANQNGCYDNDVSWATYSLRKENGEEIELGHSMEWTGD